MSEKGWQEFLAAPGIDDWVVLHSGATGVFSVASLVDAAQLTEQPVQNSGTPILCQADKSSQFS